MTTITLPRAVVEQAAEALEMCRLNGSQYLYGNERDLIFSAIKALRAALAQQAEPDHETRAELAEQQVVQLAEERDHYRNLWQKAQQAEPVEPVAWMYTGIKQDGTEHGPHLVWKPEYMDAMSASKGAKATPLYTAPPQRPPLTDEEIDACRQQGYDNDELHSPLDFREAARAVERKVRGEEKC